VTKEEIFEAGYKAGFKQAEEDAITYSCGCIRGLDEAPLQIYNAKIKKEFLKLPKEALNEP
jgi:hypothetical protein